MRIDGRFDPKAWLKPQAEEAVVSAKVVEQQDEREREMEPAISGQSEASADFASEWETNYAYTHASRTASTVTEVLEKTPDL